MADPGGGGATIQLQGTNNKLFIDGIVKNVSFNGNGINKHAFEPTRLIVGVVKIITGYDTGAFSVDTYDQFPVIHSLACNSLASGPGYPGINTINPGGNPNLSIAYNDVNVQ